MCEQLPEYRQQIEQHGYMVYDIGWIDRNCSESDFWTPVWQGWLKEKQPVEFTQQPIVFGPVSV